MCTSHTCPRIGSGLPASRLHPPAGWSLSRAEGGSGAWVCAASVATTCGPARNVARNVGHPFPFNRQASQGRHIGKRSENRRSDNRTEFERCFAGSDGLRLGADPAVDSVVDQPTGRLPCRRAHGDQVTSRMCRSIITSDRIASCSPVRAQRPVHLYATYRG